MIFNTPEAEFLAEIREAVEIPRAEKRARLLRELELSDATRHAPEPKRRAWRWWIAAARLWLGGGLAAVGVWLSGRRGDAL